MIDPHEEAKQTARLSRRNFLTLCGASSAVLTMTAFSHRSIWSPGLPVSASPTPTYANRVFLPVVSKACTDPCILFEDDFNDGLNDGVASSRHWNAPSLCQYGATVEVVADPTGSVGERGKVLRVTTQTPVELPWGPGPWQAGYPAWINFHANGDGYVSIYPESAGVQTDVWVDPLIESASLLGVHRKPVDPEATKWSVAAMEIHHYGEIAVYAFDDKGNTTRITCTDGLFRRGEWNTLKFIIEVPTGKVLPFINGQFALASVGLAPIEPVNEQIPGSFSDAHGGINFNSPTNSWPMIPVGRVVLNDNFVVFATAQ